MPGSKITLDQPPDLPLFQRHMRFHGGQRWVTIRFAAWERDPCEPNLFSAMPYATAGESDRMAFPECLVWWDLREEFDSIKHVAANLNDRVLSIAQTILEHFTDPSMPDPDEICRRIHERNTRLRQ